jgi:hypothetical protein
MSSCRNAKTETRTQFNAGYNQDEPTSDACLSERSLQRPNDIRMLGSLRAVKDCRQCHEVPGNTLLGAFFYELQKLSVL